MPLAKVEEAPHTIHRDAVGNDDDVLIRLPVRHADDSLARTPTARRGQPRQPVGMDAGAGKKAPESAPGADACSNPAHPLLNHELAGVILDDEAPGRPSCEWIDDLNAG